MPIRMAEPVFLGRELVYITECLARRQLSGGPYVAQFEHLLAEATGAAYAVACSSGTAALHLALVALGVKPGDEVIVPECTYIATANAVAYCGARPVPVDVDRVTWTMDPAAVRAVINRGTVGIIPVHLYGQPANLPALAALAEEHGLWILEDAAEALGARHGATRIGECAYARAATFSFYANKILVMGEGGAITTNDAALADRIRLLRGQGQAAEDPRYVHRVIGFNYRLTDLQAAIGCGQLERLAGHVVRRHSVCAAYGQALTGCPWFTFQGTRAETASAEWMCAVLVPEGLEVPAIQAAMRRQHIETRPVFPPISQQAPYRTGTPPAPVAAELHRRGLVLPTHAELDLVDVRMVAEALITACREAAMVGRS